MSEQTTSGTHTPDGFKDSFSFSDTPQYAAARDLAYAIEYTTEMSDLRSATHNAVNLFRDLHVSPKENQKNHELRQELAHTHHVLGRLALMAAHEAFRTVDLARVRNYGDWDATRDAEDGIARLAAAMKQTGEIDDVIPRTSEHAKRRIMIDPTLVAENGLVVVRRKRLMLSTHPVEHHFADRRPQIGYGGKTEEASMLPMSAMSHLDVDKVSEFILDTELLDAVDERAAREVYAVVRHGGPQRLSSDKHRTSQIIEAAITARHDMLTPVTTTYYADRKYKNAKRMPQTERAA